jgi:hypothetical protein
VLEGVIVHMLPTSQIVTAPRSNPKSQLAVHTGLVSAFAEGIQEVSQKFNIGILPTAELVGVGSKMSALKSWLTRSGIPQPDIGKSLEQIKEAVFTELKSSQVLPDYYRYLSGVLSSINRP